MPNVDRPVRIAGYALPLAIALIVLWAGYEAATHRRYESINSIPGELVAGESLGQSFTARYDGLSGVEVWLATYRRMTDTARSTLVMHLRASPDANEDIATATLPPEVMLAENQWFLFKFEPVESSRGKQYYIEVEAPDGEVGRSMSLLWYQPLTRGDPYAGGSAYRNGEATPGDLAFGLQYGAPPLQVWGSMIGEAGENTSPVLVWGLLVLVIAGIVIFAARPARVVAEEEGRSKRLGSLGLALGVGLAWGLLFVAIIPPWQGPDEYAHYAYAALLDKHGLDNNRVQALDLDDKDRDNDLIQAVNASADRNDFTRRIRGISNPGAPTRTDDPLFQQLRQPPAYYWLCAAALRAARLVGIPADPYSSPEVSLYVMRMVSLGLGLIVIGLAWLAFGWRLALAVALLPMHAFMASVVNNDILAEVAVSALFVAVMALLKSAFAAGEPWPSRRGLALAGICILLAVAGVGTKATAPAAALPLLVGGLVVWSAVGISRRFRRATPQPAKGTGRPLLVVGLVTAAIAVGAFFAIFEQQEDASPGWFTGYTPLMSAQRVATESAYDGSYVIELEAVQGARAEQRLVPKTIYHPALQVTVAGWARLEPGQTEQSDGQITGELVVMDGVREAGRALATLDPGGDWTRLEATGDIEANAEEIELRIGVRDGSMSGAKVQLDELSVRVVGVNGPWNDPVFKGALVDPSGEQGRWALRPLFESIMPGEVSDMASALLNPQPFSKVALWGDYASTQYRSYWGSFGWLSIDLPTLVYLAIGGLIVAAGVGLGMRAIESRKTGWGWPEWLAVVSIVSLGVAIAIGFAKQMALTAYGGLPSAPQGRYLFVLTIPAVWLLGAGLGTLFGKIWPKAAWAWKWAIANALLFLALYSLFALIMPYYYG